MSDCWERWIFAGFLWGISVVSLMAEPGIRIIGWQQRWPWNGMVDITYSIECGEKNFDGTPIDIKVSFNGYDRDLNQKISMTTFTGDGADKPVHTGGPYKITWHGEKDHPNFHSSAFQISATAVMQLKPIAEKYLVIDLSEGHEAVKYPFYYSDKGPDIQKNACRTTELWLHLLPAGIYRMGRPDGEIGGELDEMQHEVVLSSPFYIGVFEITQKQWELVMGTKPSTHKGDDRPVDSVSYDMIRGTFEFAGGGWPKYRHKVDVDSFLGKIQAKTGLMIDLPTEAQWEYACRAGTSTALNSGKNLSRKIEDSTGNMAEVGRFKENQSDGRGGYADGYHTRVGSYQPNFWNLYDMHGNVTEWCLDWYQREQGTSTVKDPEGAATGRARILRGGSWYHDSSQCRSAYRNHPYESSSYTSDKGFRVVSLPGEIPQPPVLKGKYLVVDLSSKEAGAEFPVRYSEEPPDLSKDTCRTTELWLRKIPAGKFMMGCPGDELGGGGSKLHQVILTKIFYMGIFEVTQKQWELITGYSSSASYQGDNRPIENVICDSIRGYVGSCSVGWPKYGYNVDRDSFLGKLRKRTNLLFDLPTEAQWEYACRAGTLTALNSNTNLTVAQGKCLSLDQLGRYRHNHNDQHGLYQEHTSVGSYLPNNWGLYDMHGNVAERCLDLFEYNLQTYPNIDPVGDTIGSEQVLRGGSWNDEPKNCKSASRTSVHLKHKYSCWGFRVICFPTNDEWFLQ